MGRGEARGGADRDPTEETLLPRRVWGEGGPTPTPLRRPCSDGGSGARPAELLRTPAEPLLLKLAAAPAPVLPPSSDSLPEVRRSFGYVCLLK